MYLFGKPFDLVTDNRAIQLISGHAAARPPARIERWGLRLSQFDYVIQHQPGAYNIADYLSRHPHESPSSSVEEKGSRIETEINFLVEKALPPAITRAQIASQTIVDVELNLLKKFIQSNKDQLIPAGVAKYKQFMSEISCTKDGVLLRGNRLIIPASLRSRVVELAHSGHQGIVKTKALIRSRVWYPGIDFDVEQRVQRCQLCQATATAQCYEPMRPTTMPRGPWEQVSGDFFGPGEDGTYYFVNFDKHSRNVFVKNIKSVAECHVIPVLEELFDMFGVPNEYQSDNGSPFQSYKFKEFAERSGFKHRLCTPYWPRANGEVERFMRNMGKVLRNAAGVFIFFILLFSQRLLSSISNYISIKFIFICVRFS
jgi:hypothetical protein